MLFNLKEYVYLEGDIFAHFQYEVPVAAPAEAVAVSEPLPETAPPPVVANDQAVVPVAAEASTPSDTSFLPAIYLLLLMKDTSADGAYYYITDHLGAPQIITNDAGSVVWKAEYLPFGNVNISVAEIENNLRFPGQYYDAETGLHYNWNRYYSPETGRYIAADPIGLDGGMNLYAYVEGDPVNRIDLSGLFDDTITPALIGGAVKGLIALFGAKAAKETADAIKDRTKTGEECKQCPPCSPYPVGTIGYQGPERHKTGRDAGASHYHLFEVQQIPRNCKCIWKERTKAIAGNHHYYEQPNIYYSVNLNGSGRPPSYPR